MNLGGTEKSFLNLIDSLPKDCEIDLLLLEKTGKLLPEVPSNVNVIEIDNEKVINSYLKIGVLQFGLLQFKKGRLTLGLRSVIQYILNKLFKSVNPFWAIETHITQITKHYDISVAYAGIHNFIAYYVLKKTNSIKKVLWVHFDISKVIGNSNFGTKHYPLFDQIFCVADNAGSVFKERFPATRGKVFTFNNIIKTEALARQASAGETYADDFEGLRILTLGRLSKEKGQQMIPEIISRLRADNHNFRWYLIGEGGLSAEIEAKIKEGRLEEHLVLLGRKMNPYAYLRDCDLYVMTSLYEGDPVVLREAKAFQRPIITTNFLSASNLITNTEDGLIVEISANGLFKGIKMILENPVLRDKFARIPAADLNSDREIELLLCKFVGEQC